jgi:predicted nucleic acid-binding protein
VEALTGDHRRDFHANRVLRACQIRDVTEPQAREAARLRTATGRPSTISATDAIVAAFASAWPDPVVLTSDPRDLAALSEHAAHPIAIARV